MQIVFISDTHGKHEQLQLPDADMIIHAGDITSRGTLTEAKYFIDWFAALPYRYKIFVAGNHDFCFEKTPSLAQQLVPENCIYLEDDHVLIEGLRIWGSPISPFFHNWAFNRHRGKEIKQHWDKIPAAIDILITHTPPHNILDRTVDNEIVGCEELMKKIAEVAPKIHVFGHIHEAYGTAQIGNTTFINASVLDVRYKVKNPPILIRL
ncbi:MAG: metallophosphoesterase family protein [Thermoflexibacteraceae bacterium]